MSPRSCRTRKSAARSLRTQQRAWAASTRTAFRSHRQAGCTRSASRARRPTGQCSTLELHLESERLERGSGPASVSEEQNRPVLLRKEVIQPHLPVRLPCYDFVPIADPTFDSSLSCELGHRLRVLPTFVT